MARPSNFSVIILDLGDVLVQWSAKTQTSISPETLKAILSSPIWADYERGRMGEMECYSTVGKEFNLSQTEVQKALLDARESLQADSDFINFIRELKTQSSGRLKVYAMSNISLPDWEVLRAKPADWSIFDDVFLSGAVGERKPDLRFYHHVIDSTGIDPTQAIFVDDKAENILTARSLGIHGIVFENLSTVKRALRNLTGDPVQRAREYLSRNAGNLVSITEATETHVADEFQDTFSQLLILEAINDRSILSLVEYPRTWNYFQDEHRVAKFPYDIDTTSLGLTILKKDKKIASSVMDEMLEYVNSDGIIQTYFDHRRPRIDPVVCVNALCLFYSYGRGNQLRRTLNWVYNILLNRAYIDGTRYYKTAECFLYFICRLLTRVDDEELHTLLKPLLRERIQERIGSGGDAIALAMRILICDFVGIKNEVDLRALTPLQCEDGGWEVGWIYRNGSTGICIGNRGLTTAFAIKAIETMAQSTTCESPSPSPTFVSAEKSKRASLMLKRRSGRDFLKNILPWH